MAVTIKDIAEKAGVSRATVDRVLHNRYGVNPDVAARVKKIADEMGFFPNRAGKLLAARKQPLLIGYVYPGLGNPFYDEVKRGVQDAYQELKDFGVSIAFKPVRAYHIDEHIGAAREFDKEKWGALCISTIDDLVIQDQVNKMITSGIPVITINSDLTDTKRLFYIGCDYYQAGCTAAGIYSFIRGEHLRFLIVSGTRKMKNHYQRLTGFQDTLSAKGVPYDVLEHIETTEDDEMAYQLTSEALARHPEINCVYMISAGIGGVCQAILDSGRKKQLFVVSFDDVPIIQQYIELDVINCTICQEPWLQGYKAVHMIFNYFVDGKSIAPQNYITKNIIKTKENLRT